MIWFQVTNTPWGEKVLFVFDPKSDLIAKPLHVSPFMVCVSSYFALLDWHIDYLLILYSIMISLFQMTNWFPFENALSKTRLLGKF